MTTRRPTPVTGMTATGPVLLRRGRVAILVTVLAAGALWTVRAVTSTPSKTLTLVVRAVAPGVGPGTAVEMDGLRVGEVTGIVDRGGAVTQSRSISDVFTALAALNRTADAGSLGRIVKTAWQATSGRDDDLATLSRAGELLSTTVLRRMPAIRTMFSDTQVYSADLDWAAGAVRRLGTSFESTSTVVLSAVKVVERMVMTLNAPEPFVNTIDPFIVKLTPYLNELLPALATTGGPFISIFSAVNRTLPQIDLSTLLSNALHVAGSDGAARVTVTLPRP